MSDMDDDELKATRRLNGTDICVGDYVRTKQGYIAKIERITDLYYMCDSIVYMDGYGEESDLLPIDMKLLDGTLIKGIEKVKKHSKNIIDLIEIGDYVNGYTVIDIDLKNEMICLLMPFNEENQSKYNIVWNTQYFIKSVVTHEQFSTMQYIVKED